MTLLRKLMVMLALAAAPMMTACEDDESTDSPPGEGGGSGDMTPDGMEPGGMEPGGTEPDGMEPDEMPTAGSGGGDGMGDEPKDIVDTALAAGSFEKLAEALTSADLVDVLKGEGPFTVFAPTDDAFAAFEKANPGVLAGLSKAALTDILTYHVVAGAGVLSGDLKDGQLVETVAGPVLAIGVSRDGVTVNGISVTSADIETTNGVIHVIDEIILPPGDIIEVATAAGSFATLASVLTDADLIDVLKGEGPFTVFAPTDDAFAALSAVPSGDALKNVLLYHVLSGIAGPLDLVDGGVALTVAGSPVAFDLSDGAMLKGGDGSEAKISVTNVVAKNGVIHVIDAVILPPSKDIVETAVDAGVFTALAGALTSQGLVETLQGDGPFTVFAPTDDAFGALPAVPSGDALTNVLLYHVVSGAVGAGNLSEGKVETLLDGELVTVDLSEGVKINDSGVTTANVLAKNGVIHIVDAVLVP